MSIVPKNLGDAEPVLRAAGFSRAWLYDQDEDANEAVFMVEEGELASRSNEIITSELMAVFPDYKVWLAGIRPNVPSIRIY